MRSSFCRAVAPAVLLTAALSLAPAAPVSTLLAAAVLPALADRKSVV